MNDESLKSTIAQTHLAKGKYYLDEIDGDWANLSIAAGVRWVNAEAEAIAKRVIPQDRQTVLSGRPSIGYTRTIAAQIHLADAGLYQSEIDGWWGPLSKEAARAWESANLTGNTAQFTTPYQVARHYIGVKEIPGKKHNGVILNFYRRLVISIFDDETPWCSTFVNFCALEAGFERTGKLNARSWLDIGERIARPQDARQGDVIIFERGTTGWEGHVAFIESLDRERQTARCLGGNQSDQVNIATYSLSKLLGIRRLRSLDQLQGGTNKI